MFFFATGKVLRSFYLWSCITNSCFEELFIGVIWNTVLGLNERDFSPHTSQIIYFQKEWKTRIPISYDIFNRIGNKPLKVCMISPYLAIILGPNEHSLWATINNQRLYKFCCHNKYCINCFAALPCWSVDPPSIPTFRNRYGPSLIEFIVHIKSVNGGHLSFYLWFIFHVKTRLLNHCLLVNLSSSL